MSDARRNVRLYSTIKDRKSPLKGSRPSVPHGTNFFSLSGQWRLWRAKEPTAQPWRRLQCSAVEHTWFYFCDQQPHLLCHQFKNHLCRCDKNYCSSDTVHKIGSTLTSFIVYCVVVYSVSEFWFSFYTCQVIGLKDSSEEPLMSLGHYFHEDQLEECVIYLFMMKSYTEYTKYTEYIQKKKEKKIASIIVYCSYYNLLFPRPTSHFHYSL